MLETFSTKKIHGTSYYLALLSHLIWALNLNYSDPQIAESLNSIGMKSSTGKEFTPSIVSGMLKKLRYPDALPSTLHRMLLQLVFNKQLSSKDCSVLLHPRHQMEMI